jgi:stringent starvation protein B
MKPRRPYLLRAIHEWITDSLCTPHLVVDATVAGVEVPRQYVKDGKIVLNVSWNATANLRLNNDEVSFSGRFGGKSQAVRIPIAAVLAVYARETGQGMIFTDDDVLESPHEPAPREAHAPRSSAWPAASSATHDESAERSSSASTQDHASPEPASTTPEPASPGDGDGAPPRPPSPGRGRARLKVVK